MSEKASHSRTNPDLLHRRAPHFTLRCDLSSRSRVKEGETRSFWSEGFFTANLGHRFWGHNGSRGIDAAATPVRSPPRNSSRRRHQQPVDFGCLSLSLSVLTLASFVRSGAASGFLWPSRPPNWRHLPSKWPFITFLGCYLLTPCVAQDPYSSNSVAPASVMSAAKILL